MKSLLLIGPDTIHTFNYLDLIRSYFDQIHVITHGSKFEDKDVPVYMVNFSFRNIFSIRKSVLGIRRVIEDAKPDVIHIQEVGTHAMLVFWANRKLKVPVILTGWGSDILKMPRRGYIFRWLVSKALKKANYLTADS
ncbi:MAG: glycosyltransferase, partial [Bacteroidota bacterium]|nr:glycosyltransferase [Bacteroidota bacterium]